MAFRDVEVPRKAPAGFVLSSRCHCPFASDSYRDPGSAACTPSPGGPCPGLQQRGCPRPGSDGAFSASLGSRCAALPSPSTTFPEDVAPTGTGPQGTRSACAPQTLPGKRIRTAHFVLAFSVSKAENQRPCRSLLRRGQRHSERQLRRCQGQSKQLNRSDTTLGVTPSRATSRPLFRKPPAQAQRLCCPRTQQRTGRTRLGPHMGGCSYVLAGFCLASMPGLPSPHWLCQGTSRCPVSKQKGTRGSTRRLAGRTPATNPTCPQPGVCARAQPCR